MGSIARMELKLPSKFRDVFWPSPPTSNLKSFFSKAKGLNPPPPLNADRSTAVLMLSLTLQTIHQFDYFRGYLMR